MTDSIDTFSVTAAEPGIIVTAPRSVSILDVNGVVMSNVYLPDVPTGPAVYADLNSDGLVDIIIPTRTAYVGIMAVSTSNFISVAAGFGLLVLFLCAVGLFFVIATEEDQAIRQYLMSLGLFGRRRRRAD